MNDKDLSDDELEEELEKALKANEAKRDNCGTAMPTNREVGVQRTDVKIKKKE
jgi:hypothetical protein